MFKALPHPQQRWAPNKTSVIGGALLRSYEREERGPKRRDYFSPSDAGKCARQIGYKMLGAADDGQPIQASGKFSMGLGTTIEDAVTVQLVKEFGDAITPQFKVSDTADTAHGPVPIFGFADYVIHNDDGTMTVWDLKTTGSYGYAMKVAGEVRHGQVTAPEGPSDEHTLQVGIYGWMLQADSIGVSYISREPLSGYKTDTPYMEELDDEAIVTVDFEKPLDEIAEMVTAELDRIGGIMGRVRNGLVPRRTIPGCREIKSWDSVGNGVWVDASGKSRTEWSCRYCSYRERCESDGEGVPVFVRSGKDAE